MDTERVKITVIVEDSTSLQTTIFHKASRPMVGVDHIVDDAVEEQQYKIGVNFNIEGIDVAQLYTTRDEEKLNEN